MLDRSDLTTQLKKTVSLITHLNPFVSMMSHIILADGWIADKEKEEALNILSQAFPDISEIKLYYIIESSLEKPMSLIQIDEAFKDYNYETKLLLYEILYRIAFIDGDIDPKEENVIRHFIGFFQIKSEDIEKINDKVKDKYYHDILIDRLRDAIDSVIDDDTTIQAIMSLIWAIMKADKVINDAERQEMRDIFTQIFPNISEDKLVYLKRESYKSSKDLDAVLANFIHASYLVKMSLYSIATRISFSDNKADQRELDVLNKIKETLSLKDSDAATILDNVKKEYCH